MSTLTATAQSASVLVPSSPDILGDYDVPQEFGTETEDTPSTQHSSTPPLIDARHDSLPNAPREISQPIEKLTWSGGVARIVSRTLLQQWECMITAVMSDTVIVEMHDLTDPANPLELAEIYTKAFEPYDIPQLRIGTVFYWNIGHELDKKSGQIRRYDERRVRRMPDLPRNQKNQILERARKLSELLQFK
jgi:hypothetical protein